MKRISKAIAPELEHASGPLDRAGQPEKQYGPFLNAETAAEFLDYSNCRKPVEAFRAWAKRKGIKAGHRGATLVYAKADLLRAVFGSRKAS